eukprot:753985-Hanusia_phi.AAC.5
MKETGKKSREGGDRAETCPQGTNGIARGCDRTELSGHPLDFRNRNPPSLRMSFRFCRQTPCSKQTPAPSSKPGQDSLQSNPA